MHVDAFPSCFGSGSAAAAARTLPAPAEGGPCFSTSVYKVPLGQAALTWSRAAFGLSLVVDLRLPSASSSPSSSASSGSAFTGDAPSTFRLRPWTLWKKRGSKRFYLDGNRSEGDNPQLIRPAVDFAWDLSRARFAPGGGPEPATRFFFAVAVQGEMLLVVGDMESKACKKIPGGRNDHGFSCAQTLVSRREHVVLPRSGKPYTTRARIGGREREVTIDLRPAGGGEGSRLCVEMDGERVLYVKRLRWKFRGNEQVEADDGSRFQVSWDVHRWLFCRKRDASPPAAASCSSEPGHAVLLFRFDREEAGDESHSRLDRDSKLYRAESVAGGIVGSNMAAGKKRSLMKSLSLSSSSSAASGCSSSVTEWASAEEGELWGSFSLLVNVWKS